MAKTDKKKKTAKTTGRDDKKSMAPTRKVAPMPKASPKPAKGKATKAGKDKEKSRPVAARTPVKTSVKTPAKKAALPKKPAGPVKPAKPLAGAKTKAAAKPAASASSDPRKKPGKAPAAKPTAANADASRKQSTPPPKAAVPAPKTARPAAPPARSPSGSPKKNEQAPVKAAAKASARSEPKPAAPAIAAPAASDARKTPAAAVKPAPAKDDRKPQPQKPDSKKATTGVKLLKPVQTVNPLEPPANPDALIHGQKPYIARAGEEYMSDGQIEHFRRILLAWKQELMEEVDRTVHHMQDESANLPDPNDRATQEEEFALELRTRDRERKLIKKIEKTLGLLDNGEYGFCEACGIEIGIRRLEARPTADLCFDCKTLAEIKERQVGSLA